MEKPPQELLILINNLLQPKGLTDIQEIVFIESWSGKTYGEIAEEAGYNLDYIKEVGAQLWRNLSESLGERINKKNIHSIIARYKNGCHRVSNGFDRVSPQSFAASSNLAKLDFPGTLVPLDSPFYVERPVEQIAYAEIHKPGCLLRIRGTNQMGKTSILRRIVAYGKQRGFYTASINFNQAEREIFSSLNQFLRWFVVNISRQLKLTPNLDEYWDEDVGSKMSCTIYFQAAILEALEAPLLLALDDVDCIFKYPEISSDFFPLLRSWHEKAGELEIWENLRLIVVHATEVYIPLNIHQSPFNVGLPITLPEFTLEEIEDLADRHGLQWETETQKKQDLEALRSMVGGHPYLISLALYHLTTGKITLAELLKNAPTISGIYRDRLRKYLSYLQSKPELLAGFKQVVNAKSPVPLEPIVAYQLESMGLIKLAGNKAQPYCKLYRLFFQKYLV